MFTGIVTEFGRVVDTRPTDPGRRMVVEAPDTTKGLQVGDSVAVNGVCLTAVAVDGAEFAVDAVRETLLRSNLESLTVGDRVDLERPTPASGRFDGHVVQGHVDGVGVLESREAEGDATRIRVGFAHSLAPYVVEKGSIAVDGVSLTVTAVSSVDAEPGWFEAVLIPHTIDATVLGHRRPGDMMNLEVDVIAKYIERMLEAHT